jgi:hypothetical protein
MIPHVSHGEIAFGRLKSNLVGCPEMRLPVDTRSERLPFGAFCKL